MKTFKQFIDEDMDLNHDMHKALSDLSDLDKHIVVQRHVHKRTLEDIAKEVGMHRQSVKNRESKSMRHLKKHMKGY
jgi:RNA polymerase sigma factor (sigma-70 family)